MPPCASNIKLDTVCEKYVDMPSTVTEQKKLQIHQKIVINHYRCTVSVNCTSTIHNIGSTMPPCASNIKLDTVWEKYADMPSTVTE